MTLIFDPQKATTGKTIYIVITFMFIGIVLHNGTVMAWDVVMNEEKKNLDVPEDIPIIWVNIP